MNKKPFTKEEHRIHNLLIEAHNEYIKLEVQHPNEIYEWIDALHKLQHLLGIRILRREYPEIYPIKRS